jgi:hypothetical protein
MQLDNTGQFVAMVTPYCVITIINVTLTILFMYRGLRRNSSLIGFVRMPPQYFVFPLKLLLFVGLVRDRYDINHNTKLSSKVSAVKYRLRSPTETGALFIDRSEVTNR